MANSLNDGSVQHGSRSITINVTSYVTDDFSFETTSNQILRSDENGNPSGRVTVLGETTGTATLQLASGSTTIPVHGEQFTETDDSVAHIYTVTNVGKSETNQGETKVPISFVRNITTDIV